MNCNRSDVLTEEALLLFLLKRALKRRQGVKSFDVKSEKTVSFSGGLPVLSKKTKTVDLPPLSPRKSPEVSGMVAPLSSLSMKSSPTRSPLPPLTKSPTRSPLPVLSKSPTRSPLPVLSKSPTRSPLPPLSPTRSSLPPLKSSPVSPLKGSTYKLSPLPAKTGSTLPSLTSSPVSVRKALPPLSKLTAL